MVTPITCFHNTRSARLCVLYYDGLVCTILSSVNPIIHRVPGPIFVTIPIAYGVFALVISYHT